MARAFTHYWQNATWDYERERGLGVLDQAASNQFVERGVSPNGGDTLYAISVRNGDLLLGGRLDVYRIVSQQEAERVLGRSVWEAREHALAEPRTAQPLNLDRVVPRDVVRQLRFVGGGSPVAPVFDEDGGLDQQTMRGVRELTPESAVLLDRQIERQPGGPRGAASGKEIIRGPLVVDGEPLQVGQVVRRGALHGAYGGNSQSGISPLGKHAGIFAFTGEAGEAHGYADEFQPDGTFRYYGEGRIGDMELKAGNLAINDHRRNGVRLFVFDMNSGVSAHVVFMGEFVHQRTGQDRGPGSDGVDRRRFYFDLLPVGAPLPRLDDRTAETTNVDTQFLFDEGREREIRTNRAERNRKAVKQAKELHGTTCQVCGFDFDRVYGDHGAGFIEAHHLLPVAEAAKRKKRTIDVREEMAVLCSNCHRMIHRGGRVLTLDELHEIVRSTAERRS